MAAVVMVVGARDMGGSKIGIMESICKLLLTEKSGLIGGCDL